VRYQIAEPPAQRDGLSGSCRRGAAEALFTTGDFINEGASSGFFGILDGKLVTRQLDNLILPSVTRQAILAIAERLDIEIIERPISIKEAFEAEELFTASSGYEIRPIIKLEDKIIGTGKPGKKTLRIIEHFIQDTRGGISFDEIVKNTRFQLLPAK